MALRSCVARFPKGPQVNAAGSRAIFSDGEFPGNPPGRADGVALVARNPANCSRGHTFMRRALLSLLTLGLLLQIAAGCAARDLVAHSRDPVTGELIYAPSDGKAASTGAAIGAAIAGPIGAPLGAAVGLGVAFFIRSFERKRLVRRQAAVVADNRELRCQLQAIKEDHAD